MKEKLQRTGKLVEKAKSFLGCLLLAKDSVNFIHFRNFWPLAQEVHRFLQGISVGFPAALFDSLGRGKSLQLVCSQPGLVCWGLAGLLEPLRREERKRMLRSDLPANFFFFFFAILKRIVYIYRKPPDIRN